MTDAIMFVAKVTSVRADLAKDEITITLKTNKRAFVEATELAGYVAPDAGKVTVEVTPQQMALITPD